MRYDVAVVGAGPAGSVAAAILAESGVRVALIERETLPRVKPCGGGLTLKTWNLLRELGFPVEDIPKVRKVSKIRLLGWGREGTVERSPFAVAVTDRALFDEWLAREAERRGAELVEGRAVRRMKRTSRGWELDLGGAHLEAGHVVGADGAAGRVGLLASLRRSWRPGELIIALNAILPEGGGGELLFKMDAVGMGYGWAFPFEGGLNVGVGGMPSPATDMAAAMRRHLEWLGGGDGVEVRAGIIPVSDRRVVTGNRVLLVGDAAGLADPFTGEGIYHAVLSARLAAESLLSDDPVRSYSDRMEPLLQEAKSALRVAKMVIPRMRRFFDFMMVYRPIAEKFTDYAVGRIGFSEFWGWARRRLPVAWLRTFLAGRRKF